MSQDGFILQLLLKTTFTPAPRASYTDEGKIIPPSLILSFSKQKAKGEACLPNNNELQERPGPDTPPLTGSHTPDFPFLLVEPTMPTPQVRESTSEGLRDFSKVTQLERIKLLGCEGTTPLPPISEVQAFKRKRRGERNVGPSL